MRRTTILLAVVLALAGCSNSNGGEPPETEPTPAVTASASPTLSEVEARQACVDAWLTVLKDTPGEAPDVADRPASCEGLSGQAGMYAEALKLRNAENRGRLEECLEDPACTEMPVP